MLSIFFQNHLNSLIINTPFFTCVTLCNILKITILPLFRMTENDNITLNITLFFSNNSTTH
jgi:hypothetical protein